jgi:hypothetical protein
VLSGVELVQRAPRRERTPRHRELLSLTTATWIATAYECGGGDGLVPSRPRAAGRSTTRMSRAFCR